MTATRAMARACLMLTLCLLLLGLAAGGAEAQAVYTPPAAAPGNLTCQQTTQITLPSGVWTTVAQGTGSGAITKVWLAYGNFSGGPATALQLVNIRITFDGAATAQVGGASGMPSDAFIGAGFGTSPVYRTGIWGQSVYSTTQMSGYNNIVMPYSASYKVELKPVGSDNITGYSDVETVPLTALPPGKAPPTGYRLFASFAATSSVTPYAEQSLLTTTRPTILLGLMHYMTGETDLHFLEGDYRIYYAGSSTAAFRYSGSEDFYQSSYYFTDGYTHTDEAGLVYKSGGNICAYRFWPVTMSPADAAGLKLTWCNGETANSIATTANTNSTPVLWYYQK